MTLITVRGEATVNAMPDVATVNVTVTGRDSTREAAMAQVNRAVLPLRTFLAGADVQVKDERLWTNRWINKRRTVSFNVQLTFQLESSSPEAIDRLLQVALGLPETEMNGPHWRLSDDHPAHQQAREAAIQEALARARGYAIALGGRIARIVEMNDEGVAAAMPMYAVAASGGPVTRSMASPELDIETSPRMTEATGSVRVVCEAEGVTV